MIRSDVERYKQAFESRPDTWKIFGADLVDAGSPNPCNRSPIARKVLGGRWQEAYQDWLKAGEFSRESEELMLAFILATEAIFHRRPSAPVPTTLPRRIWNEAEYQKSLGHFRDVDYWRLCLRHLQEPGQTNFSQRRNGFAKLLAENRPTEAEAYYKEHEMDQFEMGERDLAMVRMCAYVHGTESDRTHALKPVWFYGDCQARVRGPISEIELKRAFDKGVLLRTVPVWREGMSAWQQAAEVPAFRTDACTGMMPPPLLPT